MNRDNRVESLPLYRHKELYEWNEKYQEHKFFTESDFINEKRLELKRRKGVDDYDRCHEAYPYEWEEYLTFDYKDRYCALKQDTIFAKNLNNIQQIAYYSPNYSSLMMKCHMLGIDEKYVKFTLLYMYFAKERIFQYNYWNSKTENRILEGYDWWLKFREMCKEAFKNGHECCSYCDFVKNDFNK